MRLLFQNAPPHANGARRGSRGVYAGVMQAEVCVVSGEGTGSAVVVRLGQRLVLGRGTAADVKVADAKASKLHAALELSPEGLLVTDLGSRNGTLLDGAALTPNQPAVVTGSANLDIGARRAWLTVSTTECDSAGEPLPRRVLNEADFGIAKVRAESGTLTLRHGHRLPGLRRPRAG
jgi:hypothetical protein